MVGVVPTLRAEESEVRFPEGKRLFVLYERLKPPLEFTHSLLNRHEGLFSWGVNSRDMELSTHLLLVLK